MGLYTQKNSGFQSYFYRSISSWHSLDTGQTAATWLICEDDSLLKMSLSWSTENAVKSTDPRKVAG